MRSNNRAAHFLRMLVVVAVIPTITPCTGQVNVDSVKQLLPRTKDPVAHLRLLRQLTKADDLTVMETYSRATVRYADSLLAHGFAGDTAVISLKAAGYWNTGTAHARSGRRDSLLHYKTLGAETWRESGDSARMAFAFSNLAAIIAVYGRPEDALPMLAMPLAYHTAKKDSSGLCDDHTAYGSAYHFMGDLEQAIVHYMKALPLAEQFDPDINLPSILNYLGAIYQEEADLDSALVYFDRAAEAFIRSPYPSVGATSVCNAANILNEMGRRTEAKAKYRRALALLPEDGYYDERALAYSGLCEVAMANGDVDSAVVHGQVALEAGRKGAMAQALVNILAVAARAHMLVGDHRTALSLAMEAEGLCGTSTMRLELQSEVAKILSDIHSRNGEPEKALIYYKQYHTLQDSLASDANRKLAMRSQFQFAFDKKQALLAAEQNKKDAVAAEEMRRKNLQRNAFIGGFGLMVLLAGVFFTQRNRINREKKRSEELLLNILPEEIAEELKATGSAEAVHIDLVTVLFTDFKGFTAMSETLSPQELVRDLNECFSAFDHITAKYGIEKIKTIGDAYMAAGGLPTPNTTHATDVIKAALEMRDFIAEGKARKVAAGLPYFEIRIGVHTGPVVAGIVGVKKFQYDIWGDTVNTASRMESSGEVGQVNISEATYALVKDEAGLAFTPRGKVQAKGKGELEMYFVEGKPAVA